MTAPLSGLVIPNPAFRGLARQRQQVPMEPDWCTKAENVVIDGAGRLAARKGWTKLNTSAISGTPTVTQVHEFVKITGAVELITAVATNVYTGTTTPSSIKGAITQTGGNWQFVNFNGKCLGWQSGHTPIVYTGTGNFAHIVASTGTLPDGPCVLAAFGRVWGCDDDLQTIRYSALLDETKWDAADGGGAIDMRNVWTKGTDIIVRIVAFGSSLIVFGKRHIVIWTDGAGSEIGLDPTQIYVGQVIENVGLITRDALALAGEADVLFWSFNGVRSLRRTLQETATPVNELSPQNRDSLADALSVGSLDSIRAIYSALNGYFLLAHTGAAVTYCFDTKGMMEDGSMRMTTWTMVPTAGCEGVTGTVYLGFSGGFIGTYTGYQDNGSSYRFDYESGWIPAQPQGRVKMLKRMKAFLYSPASGQVTFKWWTDFKNNIRTVAKDLVGYGDEWNIDEWSLMEWSGGRANHEKYIPMAHHFEYIKIGALWVVNGRPFAIQTMTLFYEPTRLV